MSYKLGVVAGRMCVAASRQTANALRLGVPAARLSGKAPSQGYAEVPKYLQQKMKLFQLPNGLPVHVKGGTIDKALYIFTAIVCFVGFFESLRVYYVLSYPSPKTE
ncbi:cytochrome c oxidase subunit 7A1, mitochondrial-like [Homarus americanus]|uniref:cytochrome c oxidase subunit 7A1, mitochondrial-like n=1 Tax=Homarus americanus TaxID=6706 RepID=UPI001C44D72F|nr:cytochrome c oxidase subunit 7A1, mitochondrial-like [Homarus americanus]